MSANLRDRVASSLHAKFVGREEEKGLFQEMLEGKDSRCVLYLYGPGGVGKTALLAEFETIARTRGCEVFKLDARFLQAAPGALEEAFAQAVGVETIAAALLKLAAIKDTVVLLFDTFEAVSTLEDWIRTQFLPDMPSNVLVVLVSRVRPSTAWRTDPIWQTLCVSRPLRNFSKNESDDFLAKRGLPADLRATVEKLTHGHPLALTLVAEVFSQAGHIEVTRDGFSDVIEALLERFLDGVSQPLQREALEVSALARTTTEGLLAETVDEEKAAELFAWLRGLSFIEAGPQGLCPHELMRDALGLELQWRNPDRHATLHGRLRNYYALRLERAHGATQQSMLFDYIFLHRSNPVVQPFFEWNADGHPYLDSARPEDRSAIVEMVLQYEGTESARFVERMLDFRPGWFTVARYGSNPKPLGFMSCFYLEETPEEVIALDPGCLALWKFIRDSAPLRQGEHAVFFRHWMASDTYQGISPTQSQMFVNVVRTALVTPGVAVSALSCSLPNVYEPILDYGGMKMLSDAAFDIGPLQFRTYSNDWRVVSPQAWLTMLSEREVPLGAAQERTKSSAPSREGIVLSRSSFGAALQEALKGYADRGRLVGNPLLRSRLVLDRLREGEDPLDKLRSAILETAEQFKSTPKNMKLFQALATSYFRPLKSQEKAAEHLDISIASYRRHLKLGVEKLLELLWQQETGF